MKRYPANRLFTAAVALALAATLGACGDEGIDFGARPENRVRPVAPLLLPDGRPDEYVTLVDLDNDGNVDEVRRSIKWYNAVEINPVVQPTGVAYTGDPDQTSYAGRPARPGE